LNFPIVLGITSGINKGHILCLADALKKSSNVDILERNRNDTYGNEIKGKG